MVKRKEESDILAKHNHEDNYFSEESSETDPETDDEELPCSVCKLIFIGEKNLETHQRYSQHWGSVIVITLVLRFTPVIHFRCGFCSLVFPSCHTLHLHKEYSDHWSDDGFEEETDSEEEDEEENEKQRWREIDSLL